MAAPTRCARSPRRMACRSPRRRPARARCPGTIRCSAGAIGVTGSPAANALAHDADLVLAVGTRLQDFTTGSHSLFAQAKLVAINVNALRCAEMARRRPLRRRCARAALDALSDALAGGGAPTPRGTTSATREARRTGATDVAAHHRRARRRALPYDGEVIGAVQRSAAAFGGARHRRLRRRHAARPSCTSSGAPPRRAATTWNTATRAWATRSPAASASRWRSPTAKSS